jgi:hypothetical protein
MGWSRIICVMNEHFGNREEQPLDVRNRRYPINYSLDPAATNAAKRSNVLDQLARDLQIAITNLETAEHLAVEVAIESLDMECMKVISKYGHQTCFGANYPANMNELVDSLLPMAAIQRLLDLRLLVARCDPHTWRGEYHWTYLGKLALVKLRMRLHVDDSSDPPPEPSVIATTAPPPISLALGLHPRLGDVSPQ